MYLFYRICFNGSNECIKINELCIIIYKTVSNKKKRLRKIIKYLDAVLTEADRMFDTQSWHVNCIYL